MPLNTKNPSKHDDWDREFDEAIQWIHVNRNYPNSLIIHAGLTALLRCPEGKVILVDSKLSIPQLTFIYARAKKVPDFFINAKMIAMFHKYDAIAKKMDGPIRDKDGNFAAYSEPKLSIEKMKSWQSDRRNLNKLMRRSDFGCIFIEAIEMFCVATLWIPPEELTEES